MKNIQNKIIKEGMDGWIKKKGYGLLVEIKTSKMACTFLPLMQVVTFAFDSAHFSFLPFSKPQPNIPSPYGPKNTLNKFFFTLDI